MGTSGGGSVWSQPTVVFLHIGKTAGSTLRKVLLRNYPRSTVISIGSRSPNPTRLRREETIEIFESLPEGRRLSARLITGHTIFGIHELVPRPSVYITLLRDPVRLVISQYEYVRRREDHWLHAQARRLTLAEYVRSGISLETDNSQTRAISGDRETPFGVCDETMLELAKRNIEECFAVVGLTERFDESLLLMQRTFGWRRIHYVRANAAPRRTKPRLRPEVAAIVEEQNHLDIELYRWAAARLEASFRSAPGSSFDLERFRQSNRLYQTTWGALTYTVPKLIQSRFAPRLSSFRR